MKKLVFLFIFFEIVFEIFPQDYQLDIPDIKVYLNDNEIDGPIYKLTFPVSYGGKPSQMSRTLVKITNIIPLLATEVIINNNIININGLLWSGNIQINYEEQNIGITFLPFNRPLSAPFTSERLLNNSILLIDNEYYINIDLVRYLISGRTKEEKDRTILYTNDYERLDIPLSLNDCYLAFNNLLNDEVKNDIKNSPVDDLLKYHHVGLGLWIRNNWIYPSQAGE
jgi:hypothetical protein